MFMRTLVPFERLAIEVSALRWPRFHKDGQPPARFGYFIYSYNFSIISAKHSETKKRNSIDHVNEHIQCSAYV